MAENNQVLDFYTCRFPFNLAREEKLLRHGTAFRLNSAVLNSSSSDSLEGYLFLIYGVRQTRIAHLTPSHFPSNNGASIVIDELPA